MNNKAIIKEIIKGILNFSIIPFFGAGMSVPFGFKDWDSLVTEMKDELSTNQTDNLKVAQLYENEFGRRKLIEKLKLCYSINNIEDLPTFNHQLILSMTPPIIYTTNYDEGIEKTASLVRRKYYKVACLDDIVQMPHGANIIVKFHGDFSAENEIVLTENDYQKRMKAENALDIIFRSHLLGKSIFFMGYGLRDKNIDFIFNKHANLYGRDNLPTSYIIVFKNQHSLKKQEEFKQKNIKTILLESPIELHEILKEINQEVYKGDFKKQSDKMFESFPEELLLESELNNLNNYYDSIEYTDKQKADKVEETISLKLIPDTIQLKVINLLLKIVSNKDFSDDAMDIILRTINWASLDAKKSLELGIALIALTERAAYQRNLDNFKILDPIQTTEQLFKNFGTVLCIFMYLLKCYEEGKVIPQAQLSELDYTLRACKYEQHDYGDSLSIEVREEILNHFFNKHPGRKFGNSITNPTSLNDITENIINYLPKNFDKKR